MDKKELQKAKKHLLNKIEMDINSLIDCILNNVTISAETDKLEHGKQLIYNKVLIYAMNNLLKSIDTIEKEDASNLAIIPTKELLFISRATIDKIEEVFRNKGCDL